MGKFIDRQKLEAHFSPAITGKEAYTAGEVLLSIQKLPSADVVPVVHAHWTIIYESTAGVTDAKCSNCGYESLAYENDVHTDNDCHYCPCCGAKMDEEVNDA